MSFRVTCDVISSITSTTRPVGLDPLPTILITFSCLISCSRRRFSASRSLRSRLPSRRGKQIFNAIVSVTAPPPAARAPASLILSARYTSPIPPPPRCATSLKVQLPEPLKAVSASVSPVPSRCIRAGSAPA
eukprot:2962046-Rhodomonas_salina.2